MNIYKIGLTGTHCVHKSTICRALGKRLKDGGHEVLVIEENVRKSPDLVLPPDGNYLHFETLSLFRQIVEEIEGYYKILENINKNGKTGFLICDRTVFDVIPYSCYPIIMSGEIDLSDCAFFIDAANFYSQRIQPYDIIFFLRPDLDYKPEDDGFRFIDPVHRAVIDKLFEEIYGDQVIKSSIKEIPPIMDLEIKLNKILEVLPI